MNSCPFCGHLVDRVSGFPDGRPHCTNQMCIGSQGLSESDFEYGRKVVLIKEIHGLWQEIDNLNKEKSQ
jgi:hypothetical protein